MDNKLANKLFAMMCSDNDGESRNAFDKLKALMDKDDIHPTDVVFDYDDHIGDLEFNYEELTEDYKTLEAHCIKIEKELDQLVRSINPTNVYNEYIGLCERTMTNVYSYIIDYLEGRHAHHDEHEFDTLHKAVGEDPDIDWVKKCIEDFDVMVFQPARKWRPNYKALSDRCDKLKIENNNLKDKLKAQKTTPREPVEPVQAPVDMDQQDREELTNYRVEDGKPQADIKRAWRKIAPVKYGWKRHLQRLLAINGLDRKQGTINRWLNPRLYNSLSDKAKSLIEQVVTIIEAEAQRLNAMDIKDRDKAQSEYLWY